MTSLSQAEILKMYEQFRSQWHEEHPGHNENDSEAAFLRFMCSALRGQQYKIDQPKEPH